MTGFTPDTQGGTIIVSCMLQGFGLGMIFVPMSTRA